MATIKEILKQNNPTISDATLKGHDDVLRRLYKILYPEDKKKMLRNSKQYHLTS